MGVAYLTADFEAVTSFFNNPDEFVQAPSFLFLLRGTATEQDAYQPLVSRGCQEPSYRR